MVCRIACHIQKAPGTVIWLASGSAPAFPLTVAQRAGLLLEPQDILSQRHLQAGIPTHVPKLCQSSASFMDGSCYLGIILVFLVVLCCVPPWDLEGGNWGVLVSFQ